MDCNVVHGSLLETAHAHVSSKTLPGDAAVDATVGNGHDTLFLAQCVGLKGEVIGFDVQQQALDNAKHRLRDSDVSINLHCAGHEEMDTYVQQEVAAVMFNLGYLPGSDKSTITQTETTLLALSKALALLKNGGVLSVMCYPGHAGGDVESRAVTNFFENLDGSRMFRREGAGEKSPFLIVIQKNGQPHEEADRGLEL